MSNKLKLDVKKLAPAAKLVKKGAEQGASAQTLIHQGVMLAFGTGEFKSELKGKAERATEIKSRLIAWAQSAVADLAQWSTVSEYARQAASIAQAPDVVATVETGKGDNASTHTVTAKTAKTQKEIKALVKAVNKTLGVGRTRAAKIPKSPEASAVQPIESEAQRTKREIEVKAIAEGNALALRNAIVRALQAPVIAELRHAVVDALAHCGFQMAPLDIAKLKAANSKTANAAKAKVLTPVAPESLIVQTAKREQSAKRDRAAK